jgi:hypothetical protein
MPRLFRSSPSQQNIELVWCAVWRRILRRLSFPVPKLNSRGDFGDF